MTRSRFGLISVTVASGLLLAATPRAHQQGAVRPTGASIQVPSIPVPQATVPQGDAAVTTPSRGHQSVLDSAITAIDQSITADFAGDGIGGLSIGIVSGNQLLWSKHYGYADPDAKRRPDNNTDYRIGSITKQFTALAMLQLVEQGRMRLTDPIETYVPEVQYVKDPRVGTPPITLLQVATMHAGLAREPECAIPSISPVSAWQQTVLDCLPQTRYVNEPGTTYLYSNFGYATLGLAIERAGQQPFIDQVDERILAPLGMARSVMDATPRILENVAYGYQRAANGTASRAAGGHELEGRGYRVPSGALFSTITDLAKFAAWELGEGPAGLLKKETQDANYGRAFFYNATMTAAYGVGFFVQRRGDIVMLGHDGGVAGFQSALYVHRPSRVGVIVLRNCDSCPVGSGAVATRALEQLVTAKAK